MKVGAHHSHLNGLEWMIVHRKAILDEIWAIIDAIDASRFRTKLSKERGWRYGQYLYSPGDLNAEFKRLFAAVGWHESRTDYWVTDDYQLIRKTLLLEKDAQERQIIAAGKTPIYSYNQTDFVKERVAVEVQLGKYFAISYDLFVKHLAFYVGDQIDVGVEILPMKALQSQMSSGPGYYESALYDIARQGRAVPAVPLVLIGIEP